MSSTPSHPRQSLSYLRTLFAKHKIIPQARLGQCFLIDFNLQRLIVETAELCGHDLVLEVGAGAGALTTELAARAGHVLAVEVDARLYELARGAVWGCENVTLLQGDVLKNKNHLNPAVLEALRQRLGAEPGRCALKLVANLPYQVATPLISMLLGGELPFASLTVTVQQELAERLMAQPGTKDYGALSIWVQALAKVKLVRRLPPSVFWPRPAVHSCVVQMVPDVQLRKRISDLTIFHELVRRVFLHRRKTLSNALTSEYAEHFSKEQAAEFFQVHGVPSDRRPEQVTPMQWIELANDFSGPVRDRS